MRADDIDIMLERIERDMRAETDQAHGEHILGMVRGVEERREAENRALLDILHRAGQPTEPGDDAA